MANDENLIPLSERTKSEQRAIQKKGGIASGRARRKKANLRRTMEQLLTMEIPDKDIQQQLLNMGVEPTIEKAVAFKLLVNAMKTGDPQTYKAILQTMNEDSSPELKAERRARTAKLKAETEKIKKEEEQSSAGLNLTIVDEWLEEDDE